MHHNLDHIRTALPWAPLPSDFDGLPRTDAHPNHAAWHIGTGVYVSYSGDAEWSSVQLSLGDVRVALHHAPGNTEPWAASYWRRHAETIPIVSGATPEEAMRAATAHVELPPTLVNRIAKLIQHVTPAAPAMTTPLYLYATSLLPAADAIARIRAEDLDDSYPVALSEESAPVDADTWIEIASRCVPGEPLGRIADRMMRATCAHVVHPRTGTDAYPHPQIESDQQVRRAIAEWLWRQHVGLGCETYLPTGRTLRVTATDAVLLDADGREVAP